MRFFVNPVVRLLLRSPLWRLLPGVMIVETTCRRSGRYHATPVQYIPDGRDVYALSRRGRAWWRNVSDGGSVRLRVQGRIRPAEAEILRRDARLPPPLQGSVRADVAARPDAVLVRFRLTDVGPEDDPPSDALRN